MSPGPGAAVTDVTSPSAGSSTDRACGPTSHSAPFSLRHGETAYGLSAPGENSAPSHRACAVNQPPAAPCSAVHRVVPVAKRRVKKTTDATPAFSVASATSRAPATVVATGLSSSTWHPAAAARTASGAWTSGGRAIATASHAARRASTS